MSMSVHMHVDGVKPPDEHFNRMKGAWDACKAANVDVPKEVLDYFGFEYEEGGALGEPDENGVTVPLAVVNLQYDSDSPLHESIVMIDKSSMNESAKGVMIDISKLPKDVKMLRVITSMGW